MVPGSKLLLVVIVVALASLPQCRPSTDNGAVNDTRVSRETIRLVAAAFEGNVNEMEAAIKAGADVNGSDRVVGPALPAAASTGKLEAVKFLLDKGANIEIRDNQGMTALMMSTTSGNSATVRYLLTKGANPNAANLVGTMKVTALSLARLKNDEVVVRVLQEAGALE